MADPFVKKTYYAITLDPVHIGTGGYRLGRVDNTITREPGTNIPKIPGSSISGATRAYTAMAIQSANQTEINKDYEIDYKKYLKWKYQRPRYKMSIKGNGNAIIEVDADKKPLYEGDNPNEPKYYSCAGKGADDGEGHCGAPDCEVCVPFGFSKGKSGSSFQGLAQFYDARILFFPVHSMIGPVWVTCPSVLSEFGVTSSVKDRKFSAINGERNQKLNFGWIMLEHDASTKIDFSAFPDNKKFCDVCNVIMNRAYLVSDKLFSRIVNDNLEVRTSVAIDPATGAAEEGALYTYEAIPRATVMWFDVVYNRPEYFRVRQNGIDQIIQHGKNTEGEGWKWIQENVEKGLLLMEHMGVGAMNTRGMGRFRILNIGGTVHGNT
ncbi:MAG: RAMP superfamily protein [Candidatus Brocadia sinica]|nr:MAG: RAMP superfamily protein [Candidatus Brocadia sinica]